MTNLKAFTHNSTNSPQVAINRCIEDFNSWLNFEKLDAYAQYSFSITQSCVMYSNGITTHYVTLLVSY